MKKLAKLVGTFETRYVTEDGATEFVIEEIVLVRDKMESYIYVIRGEFDELMDSVAFASFGEAELRGLSKCQGIVEGTVFFCDLTGQSGAYVS